MEGNGAQAIFHGATLAREQCALVVTLNYRLGPLGFLPVDGSGRGGMNGILDVITALRWVQVNARSFGGNPGAVTLFGESAGGSAVCNLLVSPRVAAINAAARAADSSAPPLFHPAVTQSGPCTGPWAPGSVRLSRIARPLHLRSSVRSLPFERT